MVSERCEFCTRPATFRCYGHIGTFEKFACSQHEPYLLSTSVVDVDDGIRLSVESVRSPEATGDSRPGQGTGPR